MTQISYALDTDNSRVDAFVFGADISDDRGVADLANTDDFSIATIAKITGAGMAGIADANFDELS